jgi:hypothetical protein
MKDDKQNDRQGVALSEEQAYAAWSSVAPYGTGLEPETIVAFARAILSRASSSRAEVERDAARYRHIRETTKAIRDDNGGGRIEVTPDEFDAAIDAALAAAEAPNGDQS